MAEEENPTAASWENKPLPDDYPEPHEEEGEEGEEETPATDTGESTKCQSENYSSKLLQMLKTAENRRTTQDQDRDEKEAPESEAGVAEARKTDMVSRHPSRRDMCDISVRRLHRKRGSASTQAVNDLFGLYECLTNTPTRTIPTFVFFFKRWKILTEDFHKVLDPV